MIKTDKPLVQWDKNRTVEISTTETFNEVHFYNSNCLKALVVKPFDDNTKANIPNILLQEALPIVVWLVYSDESGDRSLDCDTLVISPRKMPDDYVYEETEVITFKKLTKDVEEAVKRANDISADLEEKRDSGYFNGRDGVDGKDGIDGKDGTNGVDGVNGKSAYEHAKDGGYIGSEESFAESMAHVAELEAYKANSIIAKASGVPLVITDSAKIRPQNIKTYGKSTQRTLAGTNLINLATTQSFNINDSYVFSNDGYRIEATKIADDTDTYARSRFDFSDSLIQDIAGKTVYLMADNITHGLSNNMGVVQISCTLDDNTRKYFNIGTTRLTEVCAIPANIVSADIAIYTNNYNTPLEADNTVIVEGCRLTLTENAPWEPYVGGVASPSIEYPQEVTPIGDGGSIVEKVLTGNIYNSSQRNSSGGVINVGCTATEENGVYSILSTSTDIYINNVAFTEGDNYDRNRNGMLMQIPNGITKISVNLSNKELNKNFVTYFDENKCSLGYIQNSTSNFSQEIIAGAKYFTLRFGKGDAVVGTTYETSVMVNYGQPLPYEPYSEQSLTLQTPNGLRGIPLGTTIPDAIKNSPIHMSGVYHDGEQYYIADTKNENGKDVQRISEFDGCDINWVVNGSHVNRFHASIPYPVTCVLGMSNRFKTSTWGIEYGCFGVGNYAVSNLIYIKISEDIITAEQAQEWFRTNETKFYVVLAEPIITDTSEEELAQFNALCMNYPNTTITNDANAHMCAEYVADTKSYVDQKIASAIADMQALILEN